MKKSLLLTILCLPFMAQANDSTGTVSTGGVEYIKNEHIGVAHTEKSGYRYRTHVISNYERKSK